MTFYSAFHSMRNVAFTNVKRCMSTSHIALAMPLPLAYCKKKVTEEVVAPPKVKEPEPVKYFDRPLTHEYLIQQACTANVNSASQLLTQTTVAILDTGNEYRKSLGTMRKLLAESLERTVNDRDQADLTDMITEVRSDADEQKKALMELVGLMDYVEKLVRTTAETAFIAGAEAVCNQMSDRLTAAQKELILDEAKTKDMEADCLQLQAQIVNSEKANKKYLGHKTKKPPPPAETTT